MIMRNLLSYLSSDVFDCSDLLFLIRNVSLLLLNCHHQLAETFLIVHDHLTVVLILKFRRCRKTMR